MNATGKLTLAFQHTTCHVFVRRDRPATFVNSCIRFLERQLSLAFRTNLTAHFRQRYMSDRAFYRVKDNNNVDVIDQRLTDGVASLCDQTAHIYSECLPFLLVILQRWASVEWHFIEAQGDGVHHMHFS